ncbi:MAG TPA: TlpA family protein disulfide reductase [Candidatus Butyricimonas faecavium]|nr:TlpA family protein disulfide reductase [Candidatus Butyricimonas faecavium]
MKRIVVVIMLLFVGMNLVNGQIETHPEKYGFKVWGGDEVPNFEVKMLDGKTMKIKKLRGKVVLLDFVGTQCLPCIAGLKKFKKEIFERFKGKDLVVIPIVVKCKGVEDVKKFQKHNGFDFPFGIDEKGEVASLFFEGGIPRYYVIDRKGKIVYYGPSYKPGTWEVMLYAIEKALESKK